ncbi:hypothetical protein [Kaarinaea lacus]
MEGSDFYSVRLLNPFRGVLLIVRIDSGRALSLDGINWRLQIRTDLKSIPWSLVDPNNVVNTYALYGIWSEKQGLTRLPLKPGINPVAAQQAAGELLYLLEHKLPEIPFPLMDKIEYWLVDKSTLQPLVLIASICQADDKPDTVDNQWLPSLANDNSLNIRVPNNDQSEELKRISGYAAHKYLASLLTSNPQRSIRGLWITRNADGSGETTDPKNSPTNTHRQFATTDFPQALLATERFQAKQYTTLHDYIQWQTPYLLALQDIDDETREQWEIHAFKQPLVVHNVYKTYPKIINQKLINAALVEAVLRKAAEN